MGYAVAQDRLVADGHLPPPGARTLSALLGPSDDLERRLSAHDRLLRRRATPDSSSELSPDAQTARHRLHRRHQPADRRVLRRRLDADALRVLAAGPAIGVAGSRTARSCRSTFTVNDILAWLRALQRNFDPEGRPGRLGQLDNAAMVQTLVGGLWPDQPHAACMFSDLRWINDPSALTYIPSGSKSAVDQTLDPALAARIAAIPSIGGDRTDSRHDPRYNEQMEELNAECQDGQLCLGHLGRQDRVGQPHPLLGSADGLHHAVHRRRGLDPRRRARDLGHDRSRHPRHHHRPHPAPRMVDAGGSRPHRRLLPRGAANRQPGPAWRPSRSSAAADVTIPICRSSHGPIIEPMP